MWGTGERFSPGAAKLLYHKMAILVVEPSVKIAQKNAPHFSPSSAWNHSGRFLWFTLKPPADIRRQQFGASCPHATVAIWWDTALLLSAVGIIRNWNCCGYAIATSRGALRIRL